MSDDKPSPIHEIAAAVEKISVAVDDTKAVVAAGVEAGVVVNGAPPPDNQLREKIQAILEQVGAAEWAAHDALEKLEKLRDLLAGDDKKL